ncbi:F-box family protein [Euphorbia peplus]|nr:F-box family protein [Euphorbia peplus]
MDAYDWISSLPDEILFHIISSLPFESSIQTIFLSKRWRFLWDSTLLQHGSSQEVASAISAFLSNFNGQDPSKCTRKFKFHFSNNGSFLLAIIAPKNKLFLDFSSPSNHMSNKLFNLETELNPKNLEYHFNLVDAFLDFRLGPVDNNSLISGCNFDLMLLTIKNVRVLTLCKWTFQGLICKSLSRIHAEFQFYNLKEVWWIDNEYDSDALFCFLKLCPCLEKLFVTIDPKSYCVEKKISVPCYCIEAGRNTKLGNLKVVKLDGFTNQKDQIHLAQSLGDLVTCEPMIFASSNGLCLKKKPNSHHGHYFHACVDFKDGNELYCDKHLHMVL